MVQGLIQEGEREEGHQKRQENDGAQGQEGHDQEGGDPVVPRQPAFALVGLSLSEGHPCIVFLIIDIHGILLFWFSTVPHRGLGVRPDWCRYFPEN